MFFFTRYCFSRKDVSKHYHMRGSACMLYTSTGALRSQERGQRPSSVGKSTSACIQHTSTTSSVIMLLHNSSTISKINNNRSESLIYLVYPYAGKSSSPQFLFGATVVQSTCCHHWWFGCFHLLCSHWSTIAIPESLSKSAYLQHLSNLRQLLSLAQFPWSLSCQ